MRLTDLIYSRVETESGDKLGRVFDIRVARSTRSTSARDDQEWRIVGLVVGERGIRQRFGFTHAGPAGPRRHHDAVPWDSVLRVEDGRVVVRDGTELS